ncbi:MAG: TetR/AcrR family transcriptional regulator [Candidatus Delongbacteria bacterium]
MVEKNIENTEEKIIEAANSVFEKKGYDGAKMQEIADKAGINKALLHYYFRSKDKLFEMIFAMAFNRLAKEMDFLFDADMSLEDKITVFVDKHADFLSKNRHLPLFIVNEVNRRPEMFVNIFSKLYEKEDRLKKILAQIEKEKKAGRLKDVDLRQVMINLISMNVFPFAAKPLVKGLFRMNEAEFEKFIQDRKKIVTETIINSIVKR